MYVISLPPEEIGHAYSPEDRRRIVYPYWSWKPCLICQCQRPPRAHHCPLCNTCVLKRDHHCFFTGSCIGLRNQRHFVVFTFWSSVACSYCLVHSLIYVCTHFLSRNTVWDLLLPMTVGRWALGFVGTLDSFMVGTLYSLVWFWITSLGFLIEQARAIREGITSFEMDNKIKISNTAKLESKLQGVFGDYWYLNFLFPMQAAFPCTDDGVQWKSIKA
ncbi:hypothetical protein CAPTEDRAFT_143408 [Capitella teleta]|uniref:Palmitoyltransferase n=1 Tax=Capitella teleta TaxID=283909 RepID=R7VI96_CAPTE|nr:hypothetical protein CAPTEDRAFT_143408 [Capitella teleta]|eukprot:ELU18568.1 hypothetical protein CAPTEDRAFT_143408 [Capitella teleta]